MAKGVLVEERVVLLVITQSDELVEAPFEGREGEVDMCRSDTDEVVGCG